jgi:hypothetical protein
MNATTNAKPPRKQLSDQLDRLDSILDGLGDGLNGAVADAAREGSLAARPTGDERNKRGLPVMNCAR